VATATRGSGELNINGICANTTAEKGAQRERI
jgi:hypothetical protein